MITEIFKKHWDCETSSSFNWSHENPALGQCAVSALIIQDLLGGEIYKTNHENSSHYFNNINTEIIDLTAIQFETEIDYKINVIIDRSKLLNESNTFDRYEILRKKIEKEINITLPPEEISHLTIRNPNYVAGSSENPEVKVFCQTNTRRKPINPLKMKSGQTVYMKWSGGPIVAKSKIVSWHDGKFEDSNINKLRELSIGTNLFGLTDYWNSVSKKETGYYTVIHLTDEEWINHLIYPTVVSNGSSWVYLDTLKKKIQWLTLTHEFGKEKNKGRTIPASLRFLVLKRDSFTCQYCGRKAPDVVLHIDHIIPWSKVKEHKIENLIVACQDCNLGKSDKEL